jgi:NADH:ubiquinone oxidoreductase subunit 4 (subunit M)
LGSVSFVFLALVFVSVFVLVFINLWFLRILYGPLHTVFIKNYNDISFFSGEHVALLLLVFGTIFLGLCPSIVFSYIYDDVFYYLLRGPVADIVYIS